MKLKFALVLVLIANLATAQEDNPVAFNHLLEVSPDGIYKSYFRDEYFEPTKYSCSSLYMEYKLYQDYYVFDGNIKVYYKNGSPYMVGEYQNGVKNGKFTWYDKDKKLICEGAYRDDIRVGIWNYYYPNETLKKTIEYKDQTALLTAYYNEKGVKMVENGNGHYVDTILLAGFLGICKVDGKLVDGTLDGEWKIYSKGELIAKEYFKNKEFRKGISYTKLGQVEYKDSFYASYIESIPFEGISLEAPGTLCGTSLKMTINVNESNNFNAILKKEYPVLASTAHLPENFWFFVGLNLGKSDKITGHVFTEHNEIDKNVLLDFVIKSYMTSNKVNEIETDRILIPMVIKDGRLFLSKDYEIPLLHKY